MLTALSRRAALAISGFQSSLTSTGGAAAVLTPYRRQPRLRRRRVMPLAVPACGPDLVADAAALRGLGVSVLHLFGEVLDFDGRPVPGVAIELWQCGPDGRARHDGLRPIEDEAPPAFRGYGVALTDALGGYRFRTIRPVTTATRPPHIHARLTRPPEQSLPPVGPGGLSRVSGRVLETQLYLVDEPANAGDWHWGSLGPSGQAAVSIDPVERPDGDLEAGFNFVI